MCPGKRGGGVREWGACMAVMEGIRGWARTGSGGTMGVTKGEGPGEWRDDLCAF